jgi:hypothetical protein
MSVFSVAIFFNEEGKKKTPPIVAIRIQSEEHTGSSSRVFQCSGRKRLDGQSSDGVNFV